MGPSSKLSVPLAIIIAGALIALAIFLALGKSSSSNGTVATRTAPIELRAISANEHVRGNPDAQVAMVEFSDTECPYCKRFDETMRQVIETYDPNDVAWVYRHLPLAQLHPKAPKEAEALECAAEQGGNDGFWKFSDKVYASTNSNNSLDIGVYNTPKPVPTGPDGKPYYTEKTPRSASDAGKLSDFAVELGLNKAAFEECLASDTYASYVETDSDDGANAGGNGTPYVVFVSKNKISKDTKGVLESLIPLVGAETFAISNDGYRISMSGALPYDMVKQVLDSLLNK